MNVLISGISSGLGLALCTQFLKNGDKVYGFSRNQPGLEHPDLKFSQIDLEDLDSIDEKLSELLQGVNQLDLVVLNAGMLGEISDLKDTPIPELKKIMDINLWSNKLILDNLCGSGIKLPFVLAISSGASVSGQRGWAGYGISKAALNMMVMLYAAENSNIHFISLAPGLVQTQMQDKISAHKHPEKFPVVERLQKARGTEDMPLPEDAAKKIIGAIPALKALPSGTFIDIRKLGK